MKNNTFCISVFILLICVLAVLAFILYLKYKKSQITQKQIDTKLAAFELKAIQSQMNPHFIFNSLNTIKHYVYINNNSKADFAIDCFAIFLRKYIDYSTLDYVCIEDEVKLLETYMALEKLRANDVFDWKIILPENLKQVTIPTQLIQPFIENSIKHGTQQNDKKCLITLGFKQEQNTIICTIEDDGIGIEKSTELNKNKKNYTSRGIDLIHDKIRIIKQLTGFEIVLDIANKELEQGTLVTIKIPIIK